MISSINFESCHHVYLRGQSKGQRCHKSCEFGFCEKHMIFYKTNIYTQANFKITMSVKNVKDVIEVAVKRVYINIDSAIHLIPMNDLILFKKWVKAYDKNNIVLKLCLLKQSIIEDLYNEIIKLYIPIECQPFLKVYQLAFV